MIDELLQIYTNLNTELENMITQLTEFDEKLKAAIGEYTKEETSSNEPAIGE